MKVGIVLDDSLDRPDGVQQYGLNLGKWLSSRGHDVVYICGDTKRTDLNLRSVSRNIDVRFNHNRLTVPLPVPKKNIRSLLNDEQFDVLHVQLPCSPWFAGKVVRMADKKTVIIGTFHIAPYSSLVRYGTWLWGVLMKRTLARFDQVLSVSSVAHDFAKSAAKVNSKIVPNMIDLKNMQPSKVSESSLPTIVYLGRLVERKGVQYLLSAAKLLNDKYKTEFNMVICGKGPLMPALRAYASQNGLTDRVKFIGYVEESDKPNYLASGDIVVFPSTGGESFGIVLLEGMAASRGVALGGDNPGYRSVLEDMPEAIIDPRNTEQFAKSLHTYLSNKSKSDNLKKKQKEFVKKFDIDVVGKQIAGEYKLAIAKRQSKADN